MSTTTKGKRNMAKESLAKSLKGVRFMSDRPAPQPAPDAEGEWYALGNRVVDGVASTIATAASPEFAVQIVRDHSAVPHLEAALRQAYNAAQAFIDSKNLSTAQAGLRSIACDIRAALASAQEKQ